MFICCIVELPHTTITYTQQLLCLLYHGFLYSTTTYLIFLFVYHLFLKCNHLFYCILKEIVNGKLNPAIGRKNSLFHTSVDGAVASSIIYSLVETVKANNLNVFQYIYTLLLYMPGCKNRSEGIEQLLPWSDFIKEHCSGLIDVETVTVEEHPQLPI